MTLQEAYEIACTIDNDIINVIDTIHVDLSNEFVGFIMNEYILPCTETYNIGLDWHRCKNVRTALISAIHLALYKLDYESSIDEVAKFLQHTHSLIDSCTKMMDSEPYVGYMSQYRAKYRNKLNITLKMLETIYYYDDDFAAFLINNIFKTL